MHDEKHPNPAELAVARAMCTTLLDHILEPMRRVARDAGYALTVHGSLARDIDLVAIPWVDHNLGTPDYLVARLTAVVASIVGRCNSQSGEWTVKPHGRRAKTLMVWGGRFGHVDLDLSVMPAIEKPAEEDAD